MTHNTRGEWSALLIMHETSESNSTPHTQGKRLGEHSAVRPEHRKPERRGKGAEESEVIWKSEGGRRRKRETGLKKETTT